MRNTVMADQKSLKKGHSIRYWFRVFLLVLLILLCGLGGLFERLVKNLLVEQKIEDMNDMLEIYVDELDSSFDALQNYFYVSFSDSEGIIRIENGGNDNDMAFAKMEVVNLLSDILTWDEKVESLIFYSPQAPEPVLIEAGAASAFSSREAMKEEMRALIDAQILEKSLSRDGYIMASFAGECYLLRFYKVKNSYVGMGIRTESILEKLNTSIKDYESILYVANVDGQVVSSTAEMPGEIQIQNQGQLIQTPQGRFLQINVLSSGGDFYIGRLMPTEAIFEKIDQVHMLILVMVLLFILLMEGAGLMMRRFVEKPVSQLIAGMKQVGEGNWNEELENRGKIREYRLLIANFNQMIVEIRNLKIKNYEAALEKQKVYLQYLQLQINPHFYLNALNIVYSLAQIKDYETIQRLVMALVKYLRYHFQDVNSLVALREELGHVQSYIEISQIRFSGAVDYREDVAPEVSGALIPPFIIQSFVENSIKYALRKRGSVRIQIQITKDCREQEPCLKILVRDNGNGYSEEIIGSVNSGLPMASKEGEKIGIRNVVERLKIIFGDKAKIILSNEEGAVTVLYIPMILAEDDGG